GGPAADLVAAGFGGGAGAARRRDGEQDVERSGCVQRIADAAGADGFVDGGCEGESEEVLQREGLLEVGRDRAPPGGRRATRPDRTQGATEEKRRRLALGTRLELAREREQADEEAVDEVARGDVR